MPVFIAKGGPPFVVKDAKGKVFGRHKTRAKARAQVRVVNNSVRKKEKGRGFLPREIARERARQRAKKT